MLQNEDSEKVTKSEWKKWRETLRITVEDSDIDWKINKEERNERRTEKVNVIKRNEEENVMKQKRWLLERKGQERKEIKTNMEKDNWICSEEKNIQIKIKTKKEMKEWQERKRKKEKRKKIIEIQVE